ncbi:hypothetical protein Tsubulata_013466 [Turnera subulata]|uniref:Uncharacterized protein n=1 Tax=Turnera subulata TaxID=218843 RepID=A0A9Q0F0I1_9ROSI|nr:hypothetical protein Tsubulata_013466 [Turnera subulata]
MSNTRNITAAFQVTPSPFDFRDRKCESRICLRLPQRASRKFRCHITLPVVEELDAKLKELRHKIAGLNSHQVSLKASYKKLKDRAAAMDVENAEFDLIRSAQENANLRSKIVQSPEKLQRALGEKKSVGEEAKNVVTAYNLCRCPEIMPVEELFASNHVNSVVI